MTVSDSDSGVLSRDRKAWQRSSEIANLKMLIQIYDFKSLNFFKVNENLVVMSHSACSEFFGMRNGQEYIISHFLFKKPHVVNAVNKVNISRVCE